MGIMAFYNIPKISHTFILSSHKVLNNRMTEIVNRYFSHIILCKAIIEEHVLKKEHPVMIIDQHDAMDILRTFSLNTDISEHNSSLEFLSISYIDGHKHLDFIEEKDAIEVYI